MFVLKKTVLLCVLAAAVVVAQGQDAKVFLHNGAPAGGWKGSAQDLL